MRLCAVSVFYGTCNMKLHVDASRLHEYKQPDVSCLPTSLLEGELVHVQYNMMRASIQT